MRPIKQNNNLKVAPDTNLGNSKMLQFNNLTMKVKNHFKKISSVKLLMIITVFTLFGSYCYGQTTVVQQQQQVVVNPVVIEKPVYIEKFRTVYVDRPQPKRTARKLSAPVQLLGFLWVHTEDLGEFRQHPLAIIERINAQNPYGRNNWRIPTHDELMVMEANADKVGLGDGIYMATSHSNGILRLVSTHETRKDMAVRTGQGVLINGTVWAKSNVGTTNPELKGRNFTYSEAQNVCPKGWRLPTTEEVRNLISSGAKLTLPFTCNSPINSSYFAGRYWINNTQILYFNRQIWTSAAGWRYSEREIRTVNMNQDGVSVRCVVDE